MLRRNDILRNSKYWAKSARKSPSGAAKSGAALHAVGKHRLIR
jgi:hypothetical protein